MGQTGERTAARPNLEARCVKQRIVTVGAGEELVEAFNKGVDQRSVGILSVPGWASAHSLYEALGIDLLVVVLPMEDLALDELVTASHNSEMPRLIVLAGAADYGSLMERELGRLTVLPSAAPVSELISVCSKFLRASPRTGLSLMTRLEVKIEGQADCLRMVQTHDISATGMKIATKHSVPIGTWVRFTFNWPGDPDPIVGDAEVMRHTSQKAEGIVGLGIRFTAFEGHSGQRLRDHIRQRFERP